MKEGNKEPLKPSEPSFDKEKFWSLPDEIYRSLHQWPVILAFMGLGALLGWALTFILPAEYKSVQQVYVGLNPYRAFSDAIFLAAARPAYSNIDDYKNWQMSQLETVVYLNDVAKATLDQLRQEDPYWQQVKRNQLAGMLKADWRTAGQWSLTAYHGDPQKAEQASRVWKTFVVARVEEAIAAARQTILVDQELQANKQANLQTQLRINLLEETKSALIDWQKTAEQFPQDQSLTPYQRAAILSLGVYPAEFSPAWNAILDSQPAPDASPMQYVNWSQKIIDLMQVEASHLSERITQLETDRQEIVTLFVAQSKRSLGISPNLTFEGFAEEPVRPIRSTGLWILLGCFTGLLSWGFYRLVMINQRRTA